jgi:DNA (cytosine-5)-methyltransferase 1
MNSSPKFRFIDLFAGIGGFHHALSKIGGQCVMTCELDTDCQAVYRATFPEAGKSYPLISNIRDITRHDIDDENSLRTSEQISKIVPDHDLLCGGFPCQPFSKSGEQLGLRDRARGTLFFDIVQIIEAKRPKYIFLENVRNIAGPRHVNTWKTVVDTLREQDYKVFDKPLVFSPHLLPPDHGGAPQVRDRVFIFGIRNDVENGNIANMLEFNKKLTSKAYWNPEDWSIQTTLLPDNKIKDIERYCVSEDESNYLEAWDYFVASFPSNNLPGFPIWAFAFQNKPVIDEDMPSWKKEFLLKNSIFYNQNRAFIDKFLKMRWGSNRICVLEFPYSRQILEWQARKRHPTRENRTLKDLVIQFRPSGIRVKPPTYLPALVAITQTSIVGPWLRSGAKKFRKLTPVEAGRLQGIPDHIYSNHIVPDRIAYKQLGNAVNVGIVRSSAEVLMGLNPGFNLKARVQNDLFEEESVS